MAESIREIAARASLRQVDDLRTPLNLTALLQSAHRRTVDGAADRRVSNLRPMNRLRLIALESDKRRLPSRQQRIEPSSGAKRNEPLRQVADRLSFLRASAATAPPTRDLEQAAGNAGSIAGQSRIDSGRGDAPSGVAGSYLPHSPTPMGISRQTLHGANVSPDAAVANYETRIEKLGADNERVQQQFLGLLTRLVENHARSQTALRALEARVQDQDNAIQARN